MYYKNNFIVKMYVIYKEIMNYRCSNNDTNNKLPNLSIKL